MSELTKEIAEDLIGDQTLQDEKTSEKSEEKSKEEESKLKESEETTETEEEETSKEAKPTITKEMVKEFGLADSFVGQPIEKMAKSYGEILREYKKVSNDVAELKKKLPETSDIKEEKQTEEIDITAEDVELEPEKVANYLKTIKQEVKALKALKKEILSELEPRLSVADNMAAAQTSKAVEASVQSQIDEIAEGYEAKNVMKDWAKENEALIQSFMQSKTFEGEGGLERMVTNIVTWFKAKEYDSLKGKTKEEIDKEVKKRIKEKPKTKLEKTTTHERTKSNDKSQSNVISEIVNDLIERT